MSNSDLISRKEAIETFSLVLKGCNPELDPIHIRVLSSAIRLLEDEPAVDAIPVEWLREWQDEVGTLNEWWPIMERIITVWREEQEANNGRT